MKTIYRVTLKVGYNEKEFLFDYYADVGEFVKSLCYGSDDVEVRIRRNEVEEVQANE